MRYSCALFAIAVLACGPHRDHTHDVDATGACDDGGRRCEGNTFEVCENGKWTVVDQCPLYCTDNGCTSCMGPDCVTDSCQQSAQDQSYLGCEYWAVDLDNATEIQGPPIPVAGMECGVYPSTKLISGLKVCLGAGGQMAGGCDPPGDQCPTDFTCQTAPMGACALDGDHAPFAIVVSNPNAVPVAVTVAIATGQAMTSVVDPGAIKALFPQQMGFPDLGIDGSGQFKNAYKITSNAPIVAYQFNPLNNVDVFSNDASLLIPRAGFDKRYIGVSYPTLTRRGPTVTGRDNYNGYLTVVAWKDNTQIQVTATANTNAGNDGTPSLAAGAAQTFTLNAFDVLNLEAAAGHDPYTADGLNGSDLTGTQIQGVNGTTFGVFGGHEAVRISAPSSNCCADHLEEMLFPTSTWGKQFAVSRTVIRRDAPDILRVVAAVPNTQVTFNPPPVTSTCTGPLPANGFCDVELDQPTEVVASQPITLAHLMMSSILNMDGTGDPSLSIVPPVEQFRTDYKFLAPMDYDQQFVNIVAQSGDAVMLDGAAVSGWQTFGTGRMWATAPLTIGTHLVSCAAKCSVEVYGWSQAVSYMFAGGLDLHPIVIE